MERAHAEADGVKALRCTECRRALDAPTVTLQSKSGPMFFGPICAKRLGLVAPLPANETRVQLVSMARRRKLRRPDPLQQELQLVFAC